MAAAEDIARIIEQEQGLVFEAFDENTAFAVVSHIRERAVANSWPIVCDVRLWNRQVCYVSLPGSTADNPFWVQRKANLVQRVLKSSYRVVLETNAPERTFPPSRNLPAADFALAGGGFPIRVKGAGIIGAITVSGLKERDDHEVVVEAICAVIGLDVSRFALAPPEA